MDANHDLYEVLGVEPDATQAEIKSAFRRMAKEAHPDSGQLNDRGKRFREINDAYTVLSDPEKRAEYDELRFAPPIISGPIGGNEIEPVRCEKCSEITAQPRYILLWKTWSAFVVNSKIPIQGVFCSKCATKAQISANIFSGILGWWSFWGLASTPVSIVGNALGGRKFPDVEEKLLFRNVLAFYSRGDLNLAGAIAAKLTSAKSAQIRNTVIDVLAALRAQGTPIGVLKNPWQIDAKGIGIGLMSLLSVPTALALWIWEDSIRSALDIDGSGTSEVAQIVAEPVPKPPVCAFPPSNGARLGGSIKRLRGNHILEIDNGSSGDAIVKLRDPQNLNLLYSFFVAKNKKARVNKLPDGDYILQFAFGKNLKEDCKSFYGPIANQVPELQRYRTIYEDNGEYVTKKYIRSSFTLYSVPNGNFQPQKIDAEEFDK